MNGLRVAPDTDDRPDRMLNDPDGYFAAARERAKAEVTQETARGAAGSRPSRIALTGIFLALATAAASLLGYATDHRPETAILAGTAALVAVTIIIDHLLD